MRKDLLADLTSEEMVCMQEANRDLCACCQEELSPEGECPNDCTSDPLYGFAVGFNWDRKDFLLANLLRRNSQHLQ